MGVLGSGDKKTSSQDNRAGASDNAQQALGGGRIFNLGGGGGSSPTKVSSSNLAPWIQVGIAVIALIWIITRKDK